MSAPAISRQSQSLLQAPVLAALPPAMPQAAAALSTWRWLVYQLPRTVAVAAAVGALATAVLGLLRQSTLIIAAAIAWEVTAGLALWLEAQWRSSQNVDARLDQIAGNALQAGGQVFEGLREERDELSSEVRSVREANQELEHAIDDLGQERSNMETTLRLAQEDLMRAEETEHVRASLMGEQRHVADDLRDLLQMSRSQIAQETFWNQLTDGLNRVADRYDEMVRTAAQGDDRLTQVSELLTAVQQLRAQMELRVQTGAADSLTQALDDASRLIHDLGGRLQHSEAEGMRLSQALEAEHSKLEALELQMLVCQQRLASLIREVEVLATFQSRISSRNDRGTSASHSR